jgi:hypothetical protein
MLDPKVEFQNLKSMEDHIRFKDPQRHKAKLLEFLENHLFVDNKNRCNKN